MQIGFASVLPTLECNPTPSKSNRKVLISYDRSLYRQRHKIENLFGKRKDSRRIQPRDT